MAKSNFIDWVQSTTEQIAFPQPDPRNCTLMKVNDFDFVAFSCVKDGWR